jgi:hypothetical protein
VTSGNRQVKPSTVFPACSTTSSIAVATVRADTSGSRPARVRSAAAGPAGLLGQDDVTTTRSTGTGFRTRSSTGQ